jgi:hypothetical protein
MGHRNSGMNKVVKSGEKGYLQKTVSEILKEIKEKRN